MPTVIDSLCVELGIDSSKFVQGQKTVEASFKKTKDQASSTAKEMEARGSQAASYFSQIKNEALGLFAVIVGAGGIEQFTAKTVTGLTNVARAAKLAGENLKELQSVKLTVDRMAGGGGEAAGSAITSLDDVLSRWRNQGVPIPGGPGGGMMHGLSMIGGLDRNATGGQEFAKFVTFVAKLKGTDRYRSTRAKQIGDELGFTPEMIATALQGPKAFNRETGKSRGLAMGDEDVAKASELQKAFMGLRQEMGHDATEALLFVSGPLTGLLKAFTALDKAGGGVPGDVLATAAALTTLGAAARMLMGILGIKPAAKVLPAAGAGGIGTALAVGGAAVGYVASLGYVANAENALGEAIDAKMRARGKGGHPAAHAGGARHPAAGHPAAAIPAGKASAASSIVAAFQKMGFSPDQASGMAAGVFAESLDDPAKTNPTSGTFGLGQWMPGKWKHGKYHRGRQDDFKDWAHHDIHGSSFAEQLQFMAYEFMHGEKRAAGFMHGAGGMDPALIAYVTGYMRPSPGKDTSGDLFRGRNYLRAHGAGGSTTTINLTGPINVNTSATDATGIAHAIGSALKTNLARRINTGLSG